MFGGYNKKTDETGSHGKKDIAHVAIHGTSEPHEVLPGTDGDSDSQNVPPSSSSTLNIIKANEMSISLSSMQIF